MLEAVIVVLVIALLVVVFLRRPSAGSGDVEALRNDVNILRETDRKSTRLNSSHIQKSRMPSSA